MVSRICFLVDDERHISTLKTQWEDLFKQAELDVEVRAVHSFDDPKWLSERPHFVVVDNVDVVDSPFDSRGREIENRGIEFICDHKASHSDSVFILSTDKEFSIVVLGQKFPNPDIIVPKEALASRECRRRFASVLKGMLRRSLVGTLNAPAPSDTAFCQLHGKKVLSVIEQCLFSVAGSGGDQLQQVNVESIGGGFSGSRVFKVQAYDRLGRACSPLVLKVSLGDSVSREVGNFNRFARLLLSPDVRVDLIGTGVAGDLCGAVYGFAYGAARTLQTLSSQFEVGDYSCLELLMSRVFRSPQIGWYKDCRRVESVSDYFNTEGEYSPVRDIDRLRKVKEVAVGLLGDDVDATSERFRFGTVSFPALRRVIRNRFGGVHVVSALGHGDLHSGNVIVGYEKQSIALIDFQYSGERNVFKDFVSLETSCRIDDLCDGIDSTDTFWLRVAEERCVLEGKSGSRAYLKAASTIRDAAFAAFPAELGVAGGGAGSHVCELYALSLAFHLFKLVAMEKLPLKARRQLLAGFVACGQFLNEPNPGRVV